MTIPQLVAHRGYAARYPENSLVGIEAAIQAGACGVEIDVQLTADGVAILSHDDDLSRVCGVARRVTEERFADLTQYVANEPQRFPGRFGDVHLSSLAALAETLATHRQTQLFVEIKQESIDRFGLDNVVEKVLVDINAIRQQCVIIAFDDRVVDYVRQHSDCRAGWVLSEWDRPSEQRARTLAPDFLFCNKKRLPRDDADIWQGPWRWVIYNIDTPAEALAVAARGIDQIETFAVGEMLASPELAGGICD